MMPKREHRAPILALLIGFVLVGLVGAVFPL